MIDELAEVGEAHSGWKTETSQPAITGKARLGTTRANTKCQPRSGASQATMRWTPKSDQDVMYATRAGRAAPEFARTTMNGTVTIGPPGVTMPATVAMTIPRKPPVWPR